MRRTLVLFFVITYFFSSVYSARILGIFPHPGKSHQMVFDPLLRELAERGHDLTVATFFPIENRPSNYREVNLQQLAELRLESFHVGSYEFPSWFIKIPVIGSVINQYEQHATLSRTAVDICENLVKFQPLKEILKQEYDIVITEIFNSKCVLGLLEAYGVKSPIVAMSSCPLLPGSAGRVGADDNPSYVPVVTSAHSHTMTFFQRLENVIVNVLLKQLYKDSYRKEQAVIEGYLGKTITDLSVLTNNISLILVNTYHVLDGVYPSVPGMIEIGGIHVSKPATKKMPNYIEKFLNESEHGVVLLSFGSHLSTTSISQYRQNILLNSLSKLKERVLWKHADSADDGTPVGSNILRVRWLPQNELLQHLKVKALVSHGGKLGTTEAVSAGKPMVVIPVCADQNLNAAAIRAAGVGEVIPLPKLTEQDLDTALQEVLGERMQERARLVSKMWHDRESSPLQTAVFWTERVTRWGHQSPLYAEARHLPFYQYALLDVIAFLVIIISLVIGIIVYTVLRFKGCEKYKKVKAH
ncbi:UDP-glycosyltransferase UGT5-like [Zerene cesonia]|uniref:UDP-glycosyltransferase UGT5-like n=1 Tax=Zerene cesonia TaxID=33412 RepID=UPI0018E51B10|nr:UDP-glycosyltransferase UGT5-like [Zerene cesonia]